MSILSKGKDATIENKKCDLVLKNAKYINVFTEEFSYGDIGIIDNKIIGVGEYSGNVELDCTLKVVSPGFIDGHIHIESSMVTPQIYGDIALKNGVTTVIADPHEIANVLGKDGINFMLEDSKYTPLDIYFMMPSCVPAVDFEENGGSLSAEDLEEFMDNERVLGLGEVMDVPAVINLKSSMLDKLNLFKSKIIDGHSPHISRKFLNQYILAGISTDHECSTSEEALEKISLGMNILIREGSAAKNLKDLVSAINNKNFRRFLFCTDDRHIEDIIEEGTVNNAIKLAIELGVDPIKAYIIGTYNGYCCYGFKNRGAIAPGYDADLVILDDYEQVHIDTVIKNGRIYTTLNFEAPKKSWINTMNLKPIISDDFTINSEGNKINLIEVIPNSLETILLQLDTIERDGHIDMSPYKDVLKIGVLERHKFTRHKGIGFIKGLGLRNCSIAQSIAHDSHNVIVVGDNDNDMAMAVNELIKLGGGISIVSNGKLIDSLRLEVGGIMTFSSIDKVYENVKRLNKCVKEYGLNTGIDAFITLSFMSLPVIPNIKLTTQGLFLYENFKFIPLTFN